MADAGGGCSGPVVAVVLAVGGGMMSRSGCWCSTARRLVLAAPRRRRGAGLPSRILLFKSGKKTLFLFYKAGRSPTTWSASSAAPPTHGRGQGRDPAAGLLGPIENKPIEHKGVLVLIVESHWCGCGSSRRTRRRGSGEA